MLDGQNDDALSEVINIGFARAASALSELTGHRVILDVPKVSIHPITEVGAALRELGAVEIATVHQIFTGPVSGDALLLLECDSASALTGLLTETPPHRGPLDASDREVLVEIGNILLNACLGTLGNLLQVRITFAVPRLQLDSLNALLDSLIIGTDELRYGLVIFTNFRLRDSQIGGYLVIVLGVASLDRFLQEVEKLG